jgi:hypothetical protein
MTLPDQRAFAICLGGCDPGAQSCCPRSARDDGLTDPDKEPDALRHARSPARLPGLCSRAAMRSPCSEVSGGNLPSSCAASTDKMVACVGGGDSTSWLWGFKSEEGLAPNAYTHGYSPSSTLAGSK